MMANAGAASAEMIGEGLTMYMQMGGNPGDGATLARQTGAGQAAEAFGVDLKAQFSAWAPETMINQFKEAVAAKPDCIEIMGHPGATAFHDIVKSAVDQGIVVTVGNSPMTSLQDEFKTKGMGYAGVDLYAGGALTAKYMLDQGLKSGDQAMVYGVFSRPSAASPRRASPTRSRRPASRSTAWRSPRKPTATPRSPSRSSPPISRRIPTSRRSAPSMAASPACLPRS
jgi:ABC-type sugar transport system substrate-binding protein